MGTTDVNHQRREITSYFHTYFEFIRGWKKRDKQGGNKMKKFIKLGKESVEVSEEVYKDYYKMEELIKAIK